MKNRKKSSQGLPTVRYDSKKSSIGGVNNSLEDSTSSTSSSVITSEIPEDNSSSLYTPTGKEQFYNSRNKRSRFNTSPTLKTPKRGNKYSRRSSEVEPITMQESVEKNGDDGSGTEEIERIQNTSVSNNNSGSEQTQGVVKNFVGNVEKAHDGKKNFHPTQMDAKEYLDQIRKQIAFPKFNYESKVAEQVWRLGSKRLRDNIQDRKDELNKNSQKVRVERNAKMARFKRYGNERDKSERRGYRPIPTDKHEIPYQGLLQKYGDIEKLYLKDEELRDILLPQKAIDWGHQDLKVTDPTDPTKTIVEQHWQMRTWIDKRGFVHGAEKEYEGYDTINDPDRRADKISKYVSKKNRIDMDEWVEKEIKDVTLKQEFKKFANKLMEEKEQQNLIQEQHNQTLLRVDTRIADLKELTDPKYLDKLMDDKMCEWLNSEEEAKRSITIENTNQQVINEIFGASSMKEKRGIIVKAMQKGGLTKGMVENIDLRELDIIDVHVVKGVRRKLKIQFDSCIMQERIMREVREIYFSEKRAEKQGARRKKLEGALGEVYKWKSKRQLSNSLKFSNIVEEVNLKNYNTLRKVYGNDAKSDKQILTDIRSEDRDYTGNFSGRFIDHEIYIPAKSNDESRSWTRVASRRTCNTDADFSSVVVKQMLMAIRGLSKFHGVDPFTAEEVHGGGEVLALSPEGLTELREAIKAHNKQMSELEKHDAEALMMIRLPKKQTQAEEQGGDQPNL